jgi:glutaminyl-peptide cyclotransferase
MRAGRSAAGRVVLALTALLAVVAGPAFPLAARHVSAAPTSSFDGGRAYGYLQQMVAFGPRPSGSAALKQTRAFITSELSSAGLTVTEQAFTAPLPTGPTAMVNLEVRLPGRRPERVLFTGHYDTKRSQAFPFVGASDGASSAALLMELARTLKNRPHEFTYEFVWFDGEEATCWNWDECSRPGAPDNLYGSRYYVEAAKKAGTLTSIKAMSLVDMVGARNLKVLRETQFSAPWLVDTVWATAKQLGYGSTFLDDNYPVDDDHLPFVQAGVPSLDIIDLRDYPQWHTAQDDLAHVGAAGLGAVGNVLVAAAPEIEKKIR